MVVVSERLLPVQWIYPGKDGSAPPAIRNGLVITANLR